MELWTSEEAAQHWGVTPARARGILADRHIARISGYPADDVRAVRRRQGARTDLAFPARAASLAEIATAIAARGDDATRWRIFFEFVRGADESGAAALTLTSREPPLTGDIRFDALLAAAAEHIAARRGRPGPLWTLTVDRFLSRPWWTSPLPSARAEAVLWTPASFRRRGIYLDRHDLVQDGAEATMPDPLFDAADVRHAFTELGAKLQRRNIVGQVHVFGGAAMLLAYNPERAATRDIDALFTPDAPMITAIREIAVEHGWPSTWLNNQAAAYVSRTPGEGQRVFDHPHLQVMVTPPDHLLAMKVLAARAVRDSDDLKVLFDHVGITTPNEVWPIVERFFPGTAIPVRARGLVEDLLED
ncbi:MAG: hypothetical protein U0Q20_02330 [Mycobacterium sp.]|nr:DUF6036 family nucleotidyltransferase [Mycobacterium sp.]